MTLVRGEVNIFGDVAHDSAELTLTSSPIKIGGPASAALPTAVTEGDRVSASFDLSGRQRTLALGDIAHDGADTSTSNPIKIGGLAKDFDGTDPGAVAEGDRCQFHTDRQGAQLVNIGNPYGWFTAAASGGATTGAALVANVASMSIYVTDIILSALTVTTLTLREDTSTVAFISIDMGFSGILGGANFAHSFRQPIKLAVNKPLQYTATEKVKINISGYYAP